MIVQCLLHPWVATDVLDGEPLCGFRVQDARDQIVNLRADEFGGLVGASQDLFVQLGRAVVLEREVPAHHGEQYDPDAP